MYNKKWNLLILSVCWMILKPLRYLNMNINPTIIKEIKIEISLTDLSANAITTMNGISKMAKILLIRKTIKM